MSTDACTTGQLLQQLADMLTGFVQKVLMYSSVSLALQAGTIHQDTQCWSLRKTDLFAMMTLAPL